MEAPGQNTVGKNPFRIGVSYWPKVAALDLWKHFDVDEVHEDFSVMSELGINLARVALLWQDFQPTPDAVRCAALSHLLKLCDAAAAEGVRLELLLFAGTVGDSTTFPDWLKANVETPVAVGMPSGCGLVNPFSNPQARSAAVTLVRAVARTVGSHPAVWAYNLGDRPDRLAPDCCRTAANAWLEELRKVIHEVDPKHPVTCSLGGTNLSSNATLRVDEVFSVLDHSTMDLVGLSSHLGAGAPQTEAVFGCALTTALTGKPCLLQERAPTLSSPKVSGNCANNRDCTRLMLDGLHRSGALGILMGSFSDTRQASAEGLANGGLGLLDADGNPRPHTLAIQEFARSKPQVQSFPAGLVQLGVSSDEYYSQPSIHVRRLWKEFLSLRLIT